MFLVWITWLCNCIETVRSGFSFQLQNVLGGATLHSVYLLCPSTTNSSERHLLVRFPEPLFGLSKKGNLTRHPLPSGACFNLARLGQHHNQTSVSHWIKCYHYWSCCQDANSRPTPNCMKSLPLFLLVCSGQRAFKEREKYGVCKTHWV